MKEIDYKRNPLKISNLLMQSAIITVLQGMDKAIKSELGINNFL